MIVTCIQFYSWSYTFMVY